MRTIDDELTPTDHPLIGLDAQGRPRVRGVNARVTQIVMPMAAVPGETPEQFCEHYTHLTPDDVRAALAYYAAHKDEVDEEYRQEREEEERLRELHESTPASREWRVKMWRLKTERKRSS